MKFDDDNNNNFSICSQGCGNEVSSGRWLEELFRRSHRTSAKATVFYGRNETPAYLRRGETDLAMGPGYQAWERCYLLGGELQLKRDAILKFFFSVFEIWGKFNFLRFDEIFQPEGTVKQLQDMTGWRGHQVLYFGDHPYSDLADVTLEHGWRTGAIINELGVSKREIFFFLMRER